MNKFTKTYNLFLQTANLMQPLAILLARLVIAKVFFLSGLTKVSDFSNAVYLFENEYKVPFIPPLFAAVSGTFFEIICPILLVLGFATRLACLPLIVMTAVIHFTYDQNVEHLYWFIVLFIIFTNGAGKISLDNLIASKLKGKYN
jgi:putative oxidoreductase